MKENKIELPEIEYYKNLLNRELEDSPYKFREVVLENNNVIVFTFLNISIKDRQDVIKYVKRLFSLIEFPFTITDENSTFVLPVNTLTINIRISN